MKVQLEKIVSSRKYILFHMRQSVSDIFLFFSGWTFHFRFVLTLDMYRVRSIVLFFYSLLLKKIKLNKMKFTINKNKNIIN